MRWQTLDSQADPVTARRTRGPWTAVLVVASAVLVSALVALTVVGFSYLQGQHKYARIAEHAEIGTEGALIDWDYLLSVNPDTVAWLYIPNTSINYPVVQGADNDYYLSHDFEGDQGWLAQYGAIFMDYRNEPDWSDDAYFIYGHHMNDGSMFADIAGLADQERFDRARDVYLFTPETTFELRTFSLVHCAQDEALVRTVFPSPGELAAYAQDKIDRSIVSVDAFPAIDEIDKLFAFATCDSSSRGRYVLYAFLSDSR